MKSIGNSVTLPKDTTSREEVKRWFYAIAESVASRQRDADVGRANTVHIVVRNDELQFFTYQTKVQPTALCGDIAKCAYELFCKNYPLGAKVRLLGITVTGFDYHLEQLSMDSLFAEATGEKSYEKRERVEDAVAKLRDKYGYATVQRGVVLTDDRLNGLDIRDKKE
jgi:DNA polymerase-4